MSPARCAAGGAAAGEQGRERQIRQGEVRGSFRGAPVHRERGLQ